MGRRTKNKDRNVITKRTQRARIFEFLENNRKEYHSQRIAQLLQIKNDSVRRHLWQMHKEGVIQCRKVDGFNFYFYPQQPRLYAPRRQEAKFHGIKIKWLNPSIALEGSFKQWYEEIFCKKDQTGKITIDTHKVVNQGWERLGSIHFQYSTQNLMISYGGSGRPLSRGEFIGVCEWLGRVFQCDPLQDPSWGLSQIGVGVDGMRITIDRFDGPRWRGCISIHDMLGGVARLYDKRLDNGEEGGRGEYHLNLERCTNPVMTLDSAVSVMEGGVGQVMAAEMMASVSNEIRSLGEKMELWMGMMMEWNRNKAGG